MLEKKKNYGFRKPRHRAIKSGINSSFFSHTVPERDKNVKKCPHYPTAYSVSISAMEILFSSGNQTK